MPSTVDAAALVRERGGISLDLGCGANKQSPLWVGVDARALPGVDIVQDLTHFPWVLPDACADRAVASHLLEHIPSFAPDPRFAVLAEILAEKGVLDAADMERIGELRPGGIFIRFMDEVWRVLKEGAEFAIAMPHGASLGFLQDPTHVSARGEPTWAYFDPEHYSGLYYIYQPKPWRIKFINWNPATSIELALVKRPLDWRERKLAQLAQEAAEKEQAQARAQELLLETAVG